MAMKVAVTGATGFIGQHVLAELQTRSVEPIVLVRPSTQKTLGLIRCSLVQFDLHNPPLNAFELMGKPDVVIHLAWSGLPNYKSLHHFEHELPAQYRFLKNLVESGLQTLVVTGTCFEYGMQSGSLSEGLPLRPGIPYGFAKNALRCQLEYLKATRPFQLAWARLFYLYGEGQAESSLLPQLRKAAEGGVQLFNMSGGEQLRDYLPVALTAKHLVTLALADKDIGVVNVCSGIPISVRKLVEGWIKENAWSIKINMGHYPYPDYEPMAFWGDPQKLSSLIGEATSVVSQRCHIRAA
jgi:dTDP-6-deoxy-L-talose 4-dehydrogenase (NAD+)